MFIFVLSNYFEKAHTYTSARKKAFYCVSYYFRVYQYYTQVPKYVNFFFSIYISLKTNIFPRTVKSNPLTEFEKPGMSWIDKFRISQAFLASYLNLYFLKSKIIGLTYCKRSIIELLKNISV